MRRSGTRRTKLRTRVLAGVLSITFVTLAVFGIAAVTELRHYQLSQTDSTLQNVLSITQRRLDKLVPKVESGKQPPQLQSVLGEYYVALVPDSGPTVVLQAEPDLEPRLPADLPAVASSGHAQTVTGVNGQGRLRLRAVRVDGGTLVISGNLDKVDRTVGRLQLVVTVGSAAALALIALGVVVVVRRGLRPLETMAAQADRITAGDLTERVSTEDAGSEVGRLGTALNGMLARIEASVDEREADQELMRRFFADASHELRTPLASLRANAELYQQGALPDRSQVDEAMRRIGLEAQRMGRLIDDMLRLARLDQHPEQQRDPVDLTTVLHEAVERARIAEPRRSWHARIAPALVATGDEELLRRAVDNLIANVHAHTPDDTVATVTAARRDASVVIEVSDDGPGVPPDRLPRIFDRFYRAGPQAQRPGSGLGLAIVSEIAAAHGGTADATLNHPHGLRITLTLPAGGPPSSRSGTERPGA